MFYLLKYYFYGFFQTNLEANLAFLSGLFTFNILLLKSLMKPGIITQELIMSIIFSYWRIFF